jgi:hypothetical protein
MSEPINQSSQDEGNLLAQINDLATRMRVNFGKEVVLQRDGLTSMCTAVDVLNSEPAW